MNRSCIFFSVAMALVCLGCRDSAKPAADAPPKGQTKAPTGNDAAAKKADAAAAELEKLLVQVRSPKAGVRVAAISRLESLGERSAESARVAVPVLVELLKHDDPSTRATAIRALGEIGSHATYRTSDLQGAGNPVLEAKNALSALVDTLADPDKQVRKATPRSLGVLAEDNLVAAERILAAVQPLLQSKMAVTRADAAEAVFHMADRLGRTRHQLRKDANPQTKALADRIPLLFAPLVAPLEELSRDGADEETRREAAAALKAIRALE